MRKMFCVGLGMLVIAAVVIGFAWFEFRDQLQNMVRVDQIKSYTDEFRVAVLETTSTPSSFEERVRFTSESEMEVGIEVVDLKEIGLHENHGKDGALYYRPGNPFKVGQSEPIHPDGKYSTCEIYFKVTTTSSNTLWKSRMSTGSTNIFSQSESGDGMESSLHTPMTISAVQTNWPESYQRNSWLPLANLGDYKIILTSK